MGACSTVGGQHQKTLTEHTFSCYSLVLQDVNNPLMTVFMSQEKSNTIIKQNFWGRGGGTEVCYWICESRECTTKTSKNIAVL